MTDPTTKAVDAGLIIQVLRMAEAGEWGELPDWLMPGLQFAAWHGYVANGPDRRPVLTDTGRAFLDKVGVLYRT